MAYTTQMGHRTAVGTKARGRSSGLTKLLLCAILFFIAVVAKITGVPGVSETVTAWIDAGTVEESLAVLGMSMTDPDFSVTEVVSSWVEEAFGLDTETGEGLAAASAPSAEIGQPSASVTDIPDAAPSVTPIDPTDTDAELLAASMAVSDGHVSIGDATEYSLPVSEVEHDDEPPLPDIVSTEAVSLDFGFVTPVVGYITSAFGYRDHPLDGEYKFHYGVDIGAAEGTEILAFADGVVNTVLKGDINGNYFKVRHDDGIVSMYAHCQKIVVKAGQRVKKGDVIAYVGETGQVSGPHLHFQLYKNGRIIDPTAFLEVAA